MTASGIDALREAVRGRVSAEGDEGYDEARSVMSGMIDRRPSAIVCVANVGDVMATVNYARDAGLDLAIRGRGHSAPGFGTVDPRRGQADLGPRQRVPREPEHRAVGVRRGPELAREPRNRRNPRVGSERPR